MIMLPFGGITILPVAYIRVGHISFSALDIVNHGANMTKGVGDGFKITGCVKVVMGVDIARFGMLGDLEDVVKV